MPGDFSWRRFDKTKNVGPGGLLSQQGRVQLDSDWNEFMETLDRRIRAETLDILGKCVVPTDPVSGKSNGFKIAFTQGLGKPFTIAPGRIYLDGILAENHGLPPGQNGSQTFDSVLAELRGTSEVPFDNQPFYQSLYPGYQHLPSTGSYFVYLDVWQREVTWLEDPDIVERAVNVDTTARLQTVWQVKFQSPPGNSPAQQLNCPDFAPPTKPSGGRLSVVQAPIDDQADPCVIPPSGGYRGLENHLYRVEIHDGGAPGTATFKWSRDNASFGSLVTDISGSQVTVAMLGRDAVMRFNYGDWVEILDDYLEMGGTPGQMAQVINHPDDADRVLILNPAPSGFGNTTDDLKKRHTRVRKWDQNGIVRKVDGTQLIDLTSPVSGGVITVPTDSSTQIVLEDGVAIALTIESSDPNVSPNFNPGDYWVFAARTEGAWIEPLTGAPPRGIYHHYACLAVVTNPITPGYVPADCCTSWPPASGSDCCDCTYCVTPATHGDDNGSLTIASAIQKVRDNGGGTVCIAVGTYVLNAALQIQGVSSLRIRGQGWNTILVPGPNFVPGPNQTAALMITDSAEVTIENLTIAPQTSPAASAPQPQPRNRASAASPPPDGVAISNSMFVTICHCSFTPAANTARAQETFAQDRWPAAVSLHGFLNEIKIRDNLIVGDTGIDGTRDMTVAGGTQSTLTHYTGALQAPAAVLITAGLYVEENLFWCSEAALHLDLQDQGYLTAETRFSDNTIYGCSTAGISVTAKVVGLTGPPPNALISQADTNAPAADKLLADFLELASESSITSRVEIISNVLSILGDGIRIGADEARVEGNDINLLGSELQTLIPNPTRNNPAAATGNNPANNGVVLLQSTSPLNHCLVIGNRIGGITGDGISIQSPPASAMIKQNIIDSVGGGGIVMPLPTDQSNAPSPIGAINVENNQCLNMRLTTNVGTGNGAVVQIALMDTIAIDNNILTWNPTSDTSHPTPALHYAIYCSRANTVRIANNQISDATPTGKTTGKTGIRVDGTTRLDTVKNAVLLMPISRPEADDFALSVENPSQLTDTFSNFVTIEGNHFEAAKAVNVTGVGACTLANNRCVCLGHTLGPAIYISARAIIASANFVSGPRVSMNLQTVELGNQNQPMATILGNIINGDIFLNNNGNALALNSLPYAPNLSDPGL